MEINMTISTGISNTLNTDLVALSNQVQSNDVTTKGGQIVSDLAAKVLKDIDKESSLLSPMSKKYIDDVKSIIETKEWNKLPSSAQLNSDIEFYNKLAEDITFASEFIGVDINDVLSMLLEFERKNSSIQSKIRMESREGMFNAALAEFRAKENANLAELSAGIASGVAGIVSGVASIGGGVAGLNSTRKALTSSKDSLDMSKDLSQVTDRKENLQKRHKEVSEEISNISKKIESGKIDKQTRNIEEKKIVEARIQLDKIERDLNVDDKKIKQLSSELELNNQYTSSQNQKAANISALTGGLGKFSESFIQIGASILRYQQKTEELNAEKYALSKNIANESNQAANDAYQQVRDQMHSIIQSLQSIMQDLHSSISKQVSMA
jgi:hypothetical protein